MLFSFYVLLFSNDSCGMEPKDTTVSPNHPSKRAAAQLNIEIIIIHQVDL